MSWRRRRYRQRRGPRHLANRRGELLVLALVAALALFAYLKGRDSSLPPVISGHASVIDGDSISIGGTRIRLEGIDAPEWEQDCTDPAGAAWPCGERATQELRALIGGAALTCKTHGRDQYERVLATCAKPGLASINAELVRQGWAVAFGRSPPHRLAEAEARQAKRGIWRGSFTRPADWRDSRSR